MMRGRGRSMPTIFDVADFFIAHADPDEGITNLKLQTLCGYVGDSARRFALDLLSFFAIIAP